MDTVPPWLLWRYHRFLPLHPPPFPILGSDGEFLYLNDMSGGDCFSQTAGADVTGYNYWLFATAEACLLGAFKAEVAFRSAYPLSWGCSASCWVGPALFMFYSGHAHTKSFQVFEKETVGIVCKVQQVFEKETVGLVWKVQQVWERDCRHGVHSPTGLRKRLEA